MKRTIIILGLVAILSSCNNGRIAELEAENIELKATIERLTFEAEAALAAAHDAAIRAEHQAIIAKVQAEKAQEAAEKAERE